MKRKCLNRILSILLVAAMVLSLGPTVLAAQEQRVPFRQVEADAPLEREPADIPQDTSYAPTDLVRVSIVLEDRPGLEQMEASSGLSTAALAVSPWRPIRRPWPGGFPIRSSGASPWTWCGT